MCVIIIMRGVNKRVEESNTNIKNKKGKKKILKLSQKNYGYDIIVAVIL